MNKNSLLCYTLNGYKVRCKNTRNEILEKQLPVMKPGDKTSMQLSDTEHRFSFDVPAPAWLQGDKLPVYSLRKIFNEKTVV